MTITQQDDDLGQIHLLVPDSDTYLPVPAIDRDYAQGLTLWQHKVCKRFSKRHLEGRTDATALAEAKRRITELVEADFGRKSRKTRVRPHRFLGKKSALTPSPAATPAPILLAETDHLTVDTPAPTASIPARRFTPILQQRASNAA